MATKFYILGLKTCSKCEKKIDVNLTVTDNYIVNKNSNKPINTSEALLCYCEEPILLLVSQFRADNKPLELLIPVSWYNNRNNMPLNEDQMLYYISKNVIIDQTGYIIHYDHFIKLVEYYSKFKKDTTTYYEVDSGHYSSVGMKNTGVKTNIIHY